MMNDYNPYAPQGAQPQTTPVNPYAPGAAQPTQPAAVNPYAQPAYGQPVPQANPYAQQPTQPQYAAPQAQPIQQPAYGTPQVAPYQAAPAQPYQPAPYGQPAYPQAPQQAQSTVNYAAISLSAGIAGILFCSLFWGVIALIDGVCGIILSNRAKNTTGKSGMATAGLVLSIIAIVLGVLFLFNGIMSGAEGDL